jgi:hypothetical protein
MGNLPILVLLVFSETTWSDASLRYTLFSPWTMIAPGLVLTLYVSCVALRRIPPYTYN